MTYPDRPTKQQPYEHTIQPANKQVQSFKINC